MEAMLKRLEQEEQELQFERFSNEDAITIGLMIYEAAKEKQLPITIDVTRHGHQLFHLSMPGTRPDNDYWVARKMKLVNRVNMSSLHVFAMLQCNNSSVEEWYELSHYDYAAHGGCFPIIIKDTGVIGTITVSGLPHEQDHAMVVNAVRAFLKK